MGGVVDNRLKGRNCICNAQPFLSGEGWEHSAVQSIAPRAKPVHKRPLEPKEEYYVTMEGTRYHIRHPTGFMTENSAHRGPSMGHIVKYTHKVRVHVSP